MPYRGFEGGQTPFYLRVPKVGFHNPAQKDYTEINLDRLQHLVDTRRLDPARPITLQSFLRAGLTVSRDGVKILGGGRESLRTPVEVHAARFTKTAVEAIEGIGGRTLAVYHGPEAVRQLRNPGRFARKHPELAGQPFSPPSRLRDRLLYSRPGGYLAPDAQLTGEFRQLYRVA